MKALVYDAPRSHALRDVAVPDVGAGQVRITVTQVGICGTDLHIHEGEFGAVFPLVPGHEMVGVVEALGDGVDRFAVGEQVSVNPNVYCGRCDYCLAGRLVLCRNMLGAGSNLAGYFAEQVTVPQGVVFSVEGLGLDTAVFTEPTACAMHGLETLAMRPGSRALVLGAGPTGLLLAQLLGSGGASSVTVAGPTQFKLDRAEALGIDATVLIDRTDARSDQQANQQRLMDASGGEGYDVVVEATGSPAVGDICVPITRSGGTVLVYGVTREDERMSFSPYDVFRREITIKGSFAEMTSFGAAVAALRGGRARTDGLITHRFPLDRYGEALDTLAHDRTAHKVVLVP